MSEPLCVGSSEEVERFTEYLGSNSNVDYIKISCRFDLIKVIYEFTSLFSSNKR
jgi:hypothetical protein